MKYFTALSLVAGLAAADMHVMKVHQAAANGAMTHTVVVGGMKPVETGMAPALSYFPEQINAAQGDIVKFVFMQKNHTVTQSTFEDPCKKMEGGMDSGFKPNPEGKTGPEFEWEMTVPTTEPLWFYCKQRTGSHCGKGMVFGINAKYEGDKTMAAFKQLAIQKNGTEAKPGELQQGAPQPAPSAVTIIAGGGAGELATHTGAAPAATVVAGEGVKGNGEACTCHCLCGENAFPAQAAINHFGGFAGAMVNGKAA